MPRLPAILPFLPGLSPYFALQNFVNNKLRIWGGGSPVCRAEHRSFWRDQPEGVRQGCRTLTKGQEAPFVTPRRKLRSAGNKRHPGRLFFGYFLLAEQKKVSRLSVREPTLNQAVVPATPKSPHPNPLQQERESITARSRNTATQTA